MLASPSSSAAAGPRQAGDLAPDPLDHVGEIDREVERHGEVGDDHGRLAPVHGLVPVVGARRRVLDRPLDPNGQFLRELLLPRVPGATSSPSSGRIGVSCPMPGNPDPCVWPAPPSAPRSNPPAETTRPSGAITISTGGIGVDGISAPLIDPLISETVTSIVAVPSSSTDDHVPAHDLCHVHGERLVADQLRRDLTVHRLVDLVGLLLALGERERERRGLRAVRRA